MTTLNLDDALENITSATYRRWTEHTTPSGAWSRRRFQESTTTIYPEQIRFLVNNPQTGEKRRHVGGTPLTTRIVVESHKDTRRVSALEYHSEGRANQ